MTDAVSIIKALGGNVHTGMCKCPAHDDTTASLHISERERQAALARSRSNDDTPGNNKAARSGAGGRADR
jgi:hypothetical protein